MYTKTSGDIETCYFFDDFVTVQTPFFFSDFFFSICLIAAIVMVHVLDENLNLLDCQNTLNGYHDSQVI